jgi:uroporphyrinogen III methyltransferase/synthase
MKSFPAPRVAVTRDEGASGPLTRALLRHGLDPVPCPVLAHLPAPDAAALRRILAHLEQFDWIVVSSVRTIDVLERLRRPLTLPQKVRWAAVGSSTKAALARRGVHADVVPAEAGSGSLIAALRGADDWIGRTVLVPRAAEGKPDVAAALHALGAVVTEVAAYRTVERPAEEIRSAWRAAAAQGVVLASPSAARALVNAVGASALGAVPALVAIGKTTADVLRNLGLTPQVSSRAEFTAVAQRCAALLSSADTPVHR